MKKTALILCLFGFQIPVFQLFAQDRPKLHVSNEWEECSFQLDPSLTQSDWHRFTREAGLVAYFRPLTGAEPLGAGKFDVSLLQWQTRIDEASNAWNNTFVHPDTAHWLADGPRLPIPGISVRAGITKKLDAGVYWTTNPWANYSIAGAQLQYNLVQPAQGGWSAATRVTYSMIYGPRDLTFSTMGLEAVTSKQFNLYADWLSVTPYLNASVMLANAHERSAVVKLDDEHVIGVQGAIGAVARISCFRLAVEYNQGITNTLSYRLGVAFGIPALQADRK